MSQFISVSALNFSAFLMMLGVGMIVAYLPYRVIELSGSASSVGYLASAFAASFVLLQAPIGNMADRYGFKFFIVGGYFITAFTGLLYYFTNTSSIIFVGRLLQGMGEAPIWSLAPALISIQYADSKGAMMGVYNASIHLGLTLGPLLGIFFWRIQPGNASFLFFTIVCLAGAIITLFLVKDSKPEEQKRKTIRAVFLATCVKWENIVVLSGICLFGGGYGVYLTCIPAFLITEKGIGQIWISIFFALFYLGLSLSQILAGRLSDTRGRRRFMVLGLILAGIGTATFSSLSHPWINGPLLLGGLGMGIFSVSSMSFLNELVPASLKGSISGLYYLAWGIGYCGAPIIVAQLTAQSGARVGFYVLAALLFANGAILAVWRSRMDYKRGGIKYDSIN